MKSEFYNCDNMEFMAKFPDGYFELAIVDPPYGLGMARERPRNDGRFSGNIPKDWDDKTPDDKFFTELFRVSKNQIIWGGNYFKLPPYQNFIFWNKQNPVPNFSDGELAWTSFNKPSKCFDFKYYGNLMGTTVAEKRIHISQKPIRLYEWLLANYAKQGDKILDTHVGSGSSRIACHNLKFDFFGCELDEDYFKQAEQRYQEHIRQETLF